MRCTAGKQSLFWGLLVFSGATAARATSLGEYLKMVEDKNPAFQAAHLDEEASEAKKAIDDLELSPQLLLNYKYFNDERLTLLQIDPLTFGTKTDGQYFGFGVAKKFATGTSVQVMLSENPVSGAISGGGVYPKFYNASWAVTLSQSLWKNFLGRATRLRRGRDELVSEIEKTQARLSAQTILANSEIAFWNEIYLKKEVQLRKDSLDRAKRLYEWTKRRVANGIAQNSDLVQVEALQTSREIQLNGAEDDERAAQRTLKDFLQQDVMGPDLVAVDAFEKERPDIVRNLSKSDALRADAYVAKLQSELQKIVAEETKDSIRPDLQVNAAYSATGMDAASGKSISGAFKNDHPNSSVGLSLVMDLDFFGQSEVRRSANLALESAQMKSEKLRSESASELSELLRRYNELSKRVSTSVELAKLQKSKFDLERGRLEKGRSTTFQVITFEQDAAESESTLNKLRNAERQAEANARLFITDLKRGGVQ